MGRRRKPPSLRMKDGCLVTDVYRPDGKRTTISFGPVNVRTQGQIYAAFGQWLDLYTQFPHRVLTYESPYEAIEQILNPAAIVQIGDFFGKYLSWLEESTPLLRDGRESPDIVKTRRKTMGSTYENRRTTGTMYVPSGSGFWASSKLHPIPFRSTCNLMYTQTCFGQE